AEMVVEHVPQPRLPHGHVMDGTAGPAGDGRLAGLAEQVGAARAGPGGDAGRRPVHGTLRLADGPGDLVEALAGGPALAEGVGALEQPHGHGGDVIGGVVRHGCVHGSARPSPLRRGTIWMCRWKTVCVAAAPADVMKLHSWMPYARAISTA